MPRGQSTITQTWPAGSARAAAAATARDDLLTEEHDGDGGFTQDIGPFRHYRRTVETLDDGAVRETIDYNLRVPGWSWLFRFPIRRALRNPRPPGTPSPWWAPPDQLTARQASALALLATAAMSSAFANTIFTQTATFAADSFGISDKGHELVWRDDSQ